MELQEYRRMDRLEDRMWWYRAVHGNMLALFQDQAGGAGAGSGTDPGTALGAPVLDGGCGTGGLLKRLGQGWPALRRLGLDVHADACRAARAKSGAAVVVGSVMQLPYADGSLAAVFSVDVLCHRAVDPASALAEIRRCLRPGGLLFLNLPAYEWLKSGHDARVHNVRRFTRPGVARLLRGAGLRPVRIGYWNTLLFPLMVLRRLVARSAAAGSDVKDYPGILDRLFGRITDAERRLIERGIDLPFGGSVIAVAVKE